MQLSEICQWADYHMPRNSKCKQGLRYLNLQTDMLRTELFSPNQVWHVSITLLYYLYVCGKMASKLLHQLNVVLDNIVLIYVSRLSLTDVQLTSITNWQSTTSQLFSMTSMHSCSVR